MLSPSPQAPDNLLLTPREVAEIFGVRTTTIARWVRAGKLAAQQTPGGHRRYRRADVQALLDAQTVSDPSQKASLEDAARLYQQGWSIRQVAERFDCSYGAMRRILQSNTTLRNRSE